MVNSQSARDQLGAKEQHGEQRVLHVINEDHLLECQRLKCLWKRYRIKKQIGSIKADIYIIQEIENL